MPGRELVDGRAHDCDAVLGILDICVCDAIEEFVVDGVGYQGGGEFAEILLKS